MTFTVRYDVNQFNRLQASTVTSHVRVHDSCSTSTVSSRNQCRADVPHDIIHACISNSPEHTMTHACSLLQYCCNIPASVCTYIQHNASCNIQLIREVKLMIVYAEHHYSNNTCHLVVPIQLQPTCMQLCIYVYYHSLKGLTIIIYCHMQLAIGSTVYYISDVSVQVPLPPIMLPHSSKACIIIILSVHYNMPNIVMQHDHDNYYKADNCIFRAHHS